MQALATASDLLTLGVDTSNASLTAQALAAASDAVREAAGALISLSVSTFDVQGASSQWLGLPTQPVQSVDAVAIDGVSVADWRLISGRLWRRGGWSPSCHPSLVTVTMTHGYQDVPADIVLLVAELAGAVINSAADGGVESRIGVQSERIDDYGVTFETGAGAVASSVELPERTRQRLRQRFGGGVHVTGVLS